MLERLVAASGSSNPPLSIPLATVGSFGGVRLLVNEPVLSHALGEDLVSVGDSAQRPVSGSGSLVQGSKSYADLLRYSKSSVEPLPKPSTPSMKGVLFLLK